MKKILAFLFVALAVVGISGYAALHLAFSLDAKSKVKKEVTVADSGKDVTREFKLKAFNQIEVEGGFQVEFTQGSQTPVSVTGGQLEMEHLTVVVKDATLKIGFDKEYYSLTNNKSHKRRPRVSVSISAPELRKVEMALSSSFKAESIKQDGEVKLEAETSGSITVKRIECSYLSVEADTSSLVEIDSANVNTLKADADTSGSIRVNGVAKRAILKADTSGSVKVNDLSATSLMADVDTSGSVSVGNFVGDDVRGRADTRGKIVLKGKANSVDFGADTNGYINAGDLTADTASVKSDTGGKVVYCAKNTLNSNSSLVNTYKDK